MNLTIFYIICLIGYLLIVVLTSTILFADNVCLQSTTIQKWLGAVMTIAFANIMQLILFFYSNRFKTQRITPLILAVGALVQLVSLIGTKVNLSKCTNLGNGFDVVSIIVSIVVFLIFCGITYYNRVPKFFEPLPRIVREYSKEALLLPKISQQTAPRGSKSRFRYALNALPPETYNTPPTAAPRTRTAAVPRGARSRSQTVLSNTTSDDNEIDSFLTAVPRGARSRSQTVLSNTTPTAADDNEIDSFYDPIEDSESERAAQDLGFNYSFGQF
jgi:hypothetical protein